MKYLLSILVVTLLFSCANDTKTDAIEQTTAVDFTIQNDQEIVNYLNENNLVAQKSDSGLYYIIDEPGTGAQPSSTSEVTVAYKGYFTNGSIFDESDSNGITFPLNGVIRGWTEGIPLFKEGGKGALLIPSHLGYGTQGTRGIPGGAVLIFDINLISVN